MRYRLDLYERTNTTRQAILAPVLRGIWRRGLPNEDSIEFDLPMYGRTGERLYDTHDDADGSETAVLMPQKWVRLVDIDLASYRSYIIREITKSRDQDGQAVLSLKCEGYAFKFLDKIVPLVTDFAGVTASIFLEQILAGTGLTVSANQIPTSEKRTVHIGYPNVVEALNIVTDNWDETVGGVKKRFFWRINENNTVDILREDTYGATLAPKFNPKRNLLSLTKELSSKKLANRMYASTKDGGSLIESGRTHYYDSIQGPAITTVGDSDILTLNGFGDTSEKLAVRSFVYPMVQANITWSDPGSADVTVIVELRRASDSAVRARAEKKYRFLNGEGQYYFKDFVLPVLENTDVDQIFVKFEAFTVLSGTVTAKDIRLHETQYWTAPNTDYVDGATQAVYGIVEGGFRDETLSLGAHNFISDQKRITGTRASPTVTLKEVNADLTGTYTSGICAGWVRSSASVTCAENTNSAFIRHGTKSQKVSTSVDGGWLETEFPFPFKPDSFVYYFEFNAYIETGNLGFALVNFSTGFTEFDYTVAGLGFVKVSGFFMKTNNSQGLMGGNGVPTNGYNHKFRFYGIRLGTTDPVFYLDSAMICIAEGERPFTRKSIADDLRTKALYQMGLNESPAKTFSLDMADLGELEPNIHSAERFAPGDYIKIDDKTLNVTATLRVQQKTTDLINPEKSRVEVDLLPLQPSDVLFRALGKPELAVQRS